MAQTPEKRLIAYEREVLPAWEVAQILLDAHGARAFEIVAEKLAVAVQNRHELGTMFINKVLRLLVELTVADALTLPPETSSF